jgi:hypothetical protein
LGGLGGKIWGFVIDAQAHGSSPENVRKKVVNRLSSIP